MSTQPPDRAPIFAFDDEVTGTFPSGGYPVRGILKAITPHPDGDFAVVIVTADAGLYRRGDVITPRMSWLSKVVA